MQSKGFPYLAICLAAVSLTGCLSNETTVEPRDEHPPPHDVTGWNVSGNMLISVEGNGTGKATVNVSGGPLSWFWIYWPLPPDVNYDFSTESQVEAKTTGDEQLALFLEPMPLVNSPGGPEPAEESIFQILRMDWNHENSVSKFGTFPNHEVLGIVSAIAMTNEFTLSLKVDFRDKKPGNPVVIAGSGIIARTANAIVGQPSLVSQEISDNFSSGGWTHAGIAHLLDATSRVDLQNFSFYFPNGFHGSGTSYSYGFSSSGQAWDSWGTFRNAPGETWAHIIWASPDVAGRLALIHVPGFFLPPNLGAHVGYDGKLR